MQNSFIEVRWLLVGPPPPISQAKELAQALLQIYSQLPLDIQRRVRLPIRVAYAQENQSLQEVRSQEDFLILINAQFMGQSSELQLWVHEFFHWILNSQRVGEKDWVQEGLAQVFEWKVLDHLNALHVSAFLEDPNFPFFQAYDLLRPSRSQYGQHLMYFYYLYSNCGQDSLFWDLVRGSATGDALINQALARQKKSLKICLSFQDSLFGFALAKAHQHAIYSTRGVDRSYEIPGISDQPRLPRLSNLNSLRQWIHESGVGAVAEVLPSNVGLIKSDSVRFYYLEMQFPFRVQHEKLPSSKAVIVKVGESFVDFL